MNGIVEANSPEPHSVEGRNVRGDQQANIEVGFPEAHPDYLTRAGHELKDAIWALGEWGARWIFNDPKRGELDPSLLLWWVHNGIDRRLLPPQRVAVRFDFYGARARTLWLTLEPNDVYCVTLPLPAMRLSTTLAPSSRRSRLARSVREMPGRPRNKSLK